MKQTSSVFFDIIKQISNLYYKMMTSNEMSHVMRKPDFLHICENNKDAYHLCRNCTPDQYLCFYFRDSTIPFVFLNPKFHASSHLLWLYKSVCFRPGLKPRS